MERHFTVTGFVVDGDRTLLHWHQKNQMWLPPGGHIDDGEDPVQAVVREVSEETGVRAEVVASSPPYAFGAPAQLPPPHTILVEDIADGPHQHIDLIYFLRPASRNAAASIDPERGFLWVSGQQLRENDVPLLACGPELPVPADVRALGLAAIAHVRAAEGRGAFEGVPREDF